MKRKAKDQARKTKRVKVAGLYGSTAVNPGRRRSWGEFGTDMAAGASGAMLGYISGNVPGAIVGGHYGNRLSQFKRRKSYPTTLFDTEYDVPEEGGGNLFDKEKTNSTMNSVYSGSFGRMRRNNTTNEYDAALKTGHGRIVECRGSVQGPHAVYVGMSTFDIESVAEVIIVAALRKLFKKCGYDITDPSANLALSNVNDNDSSQFSLLSTFCNADGTETNDLYNLISGETLLSLAINSQQKQAIIDYSVGSNSRILRQLNLVRIQPEGYVLSLGKLQMINMKVNLKMSNKINIQNRTKSTDGAAETDRVDIQPLVGRMFHFNKSTPFVNHHGNIGSAPNMTSLFERWESLKAGMHLITDSQAGFDVNLRKVPYSSYFRNCSKSAGVTIPPGGIKQHLISNSYVGYFEDFVKKLAWFNGNNATRAQKVGDCVLFGFEERIDSGSAQNIVAQYQNELRVYGYLSVGRVPRSKPLFYEKTFSV